MIPPTGADAIERYARPAASARRVHADERALVRRGADLFIAIVAVIALAPLLLATALLIWLQDGGPALFSHCRLGEGGRTFKCWKFRTMVVNAQERLAQHLNSNPEAAAEWTRFHKLKDDPRITPLGRFLRKSSVDEIPQLLNVIAGEMSIVGPRPIVEAERCKYGRYIAEYFSVRPGITGLWQVGGRNDVSYRRRVAIDVIYVRKRSLLLDLKILILTIPAILTRKGAH